MSMTILHIAVIRGPNVSVACMLMMTLSHTKPATREIRSGKLIKLSRISKIISCIPISCYLGGISNPIPIFSTVSNPLYLMSAKVYWIGIQILTIISPVQ